MQLSRLNQLTRVETSNARATGPGLLNIAGNPFPTELINAANQGINQLWDYLANNEQPDKPDQTQPDPNTTQPPTRTAVTTLTGTAVTTTRAALENPLTLINRYLDDPNTPLNPVTEDALRRDVGTIMLQLGGLEPDRFIVERALARIVTKLAELGQIGSGARSLLVRLGAEPAQLVDRIVGVLQQIADVIVTLWGRDQPDPAAPIVEVGELSERLVDEVGTAIKGAPGLRKLLASVPAPKTLTESEHQNLIVDQIVMQLAFAINGFWGHWVPPEQ